MTLTPFSNDEFELAVITDGDTFRVLAPQLAKALGFREAFDLLRSIPEAEKGSELVRTLGGEQRVGCVTEPGFYRALGQRQAARIADEQIRSQVERFQAWVYGDVLPSIRKAGSYGAPAPLEGPELLARALIEAADTIKAIEAARDEAEEQLAIAAPKAEAFDRWLSSNVGYSVGDVAKALRAAGALTGRNRLFEFMDGLGWIFRESGQWHPAQSQLETKRLRLQLGTQLNSRTGEQFQTVTIRITPKGVAALAKAYGVDGGVVAEALGGEAAA